MGSIYKRKHKRPIPENAEIVVKRGTTRAVWVAKDGRTHRAVASSLKPLGRKRLCKVNIMNTFRRTLWDEPTR